MNSVPHNVYELLLLFKDSDLVQANPKLFGNLKTSLKKHLFPLYLNSLEGSFEEKALRISLTTFLDAQERLKAKTEDLVSSGLSKGAVNNYKSALNRLFQWMQSQVWASQLWDSSDLERIPRMMLGSNIDNAPKGRRVNAEPYSLPEELIPPLVASQLQQLEKYLTAPMVSKRKGPPIRDITWFNYRKHILCFCGWLHFIQGIPLSELDIRFMVNDGTPSPRDKLDAFIEWGINEKGNGFGWGSSMSAAALNIAKWAYGGLSKKTRFQDIEEVESVRAKANEMSNLAKKEPSRLNLENKLITFPEVLLCLKYLKQCTAPKKYKNTMRNAKTILESWQRYMIIAILTYIPVRQREIREMEMGKTLFRTDKGYVVRLPPKKHKAGSKTGKGREYPIPSILTADLDYWINVQRASFNLEHDLVFFSIRKFGHPMGCQGFTNIVKTAMYKATLATLGVAKHPTPHDFRRIAITYQRQHGDPRQQEALAEVMGHSVREANRTYDQTSSLQKSEMAAEWWNPISAKSEVQTQPNPPQEPLVPLKISVVLPQTPVKTRKRKKDNVTPGQLSLL